MSVPGFIFGGDTGIKSPEDLARARSIAEALLMPQRPAQNVGEGLAVLGQAIRGRREMNAANRAQAAGDASASSAISQALGGGGQFPPAPGGGSAPAAGASNYRDAIAGIESAGSGDYSAVGPTSKTLGRALGRYQVMEANIGPWSKEALGREVSPQEFLANPQIQDAVFDHQFGKYVQKYGNPQDAASAWFTGGPLSTGAKKKDVLGTSGAAYVDKFSRGLGSGGGVAAALAGAPQPQQVASLDPSVGMPPAPSPVAAALQLPQQAPVPQARPDVAAALNGAPPPGAVGGPGATTPAGQRVLGQMMSPLPMGGNAMQMQPPQGTPPAPATDQSGKPQGPGTPGEIRKGADGKTYQYAQTTGMAGATGDQGWIETSMAAPQGAPAAPAAPSLPVMAGGSSDAIAPGQGGPSVQQLMQAAQNPWLKPEQRQLVNSLLAQKMKQSDPATLLEMEKNRLEMEKTRIETERLRNPQMSPADKARLDLDTQKFQADQKKLMELSPGTTVFDPATRAPVYSAPKQESKPAGIAEYEYAKAQGFPGTYADWEASKKGGMSLQVDPTTGEVTFQQGGNIKPMTEAQSKDTTFATRAAGALPLLDKFGDSLTSLSQSAGGQVPMVGNYLKSPEYQQAEQAGKEFLQAILRKDTGAAITAGETAEYGSVYLPRPGDSPELLAQKKASRTRALEAMKAGMTPQAILAQEKALAASGSPTAPAAPTGQPKKSTVIDGYTIEEVQ